MFSTGNRSFKELSLIRFFLKLKLNVIASDVAIYIDVLFLARASLKFLVISSLKLLIIYGIWILTKQYNINYLKSGKKLKKYILKTFLDFLVRFFLIFRSLFV